MFTTFRPDPNEPGNADTYIASGAYANNNFGGAEILDVGTFNLGKSSQSQFHILLRFDIRPLLTAKIVDATLTLRASEAQAPSDTFTLHKLESAWEKFSVTWNSIAGGNYGPAVDSVYVDLPVDLVFDAKTLVEDAIADDGIFTALIKGTATSGLHLLECYSASAAVSLRPQLAVNWEPTGLVMASGYGVVHDYKPRKLSLRGMIRKAQRRG